MKVERDVPILFPIRTVAKILSISRSAVYVLLRDGKLGSVNIGRSRRVTEDQLVAFIDSLQIIAAS
jgi:excisionase family DNA binding protein